MKRAVAGGRSGSGLMFDLDLCAWISTLVYDGILGFIIWLGDKAGCSGVWSEGFLDIIKRPGTSLTMDLYT